MHHGKVLLLTVVYTAYLTRVFDVIIVTICSRETVWMAFDGSRVRYPTLSKFIMMAAVLSQMYENKASTAIIFSCSVTSIWSEKIGRSVNWHVRVDSS